AARVGRARDAAALGVADEAAQAAVLLQLPRLALVVAHLQLLIERAPLLAGAARRVERARLRARGRADSDNDGETGDDERPRHHPCAGNFTQRASFAYAVQYDEPFHRYVY